MLSFTYNPGSNLTFLHLDGGFSYGRTGYYPESNSIELYLSPRSAGLLRGTLKNVVLPTIHPGEKPEVPDWVHDTGSHAPVVIEEYSIQTKAIAIGHPGNLTLRPRSTDGFTTFVALTHPRRASEGMNEVEFRLRFWLTERSIPTLDLLQKEFRRNYEKRNQSMHITFTIDSGELALLVRQFELLRELYLETVQTKTVEEMIQEAPTGLKVEW